MSREYQMPVHTYTDTQTQASLAQLRTEGEEIIRWMILVSLPDGKAGGQLAGQAPDELGEFQ